jgi:cell division transport system permease protein
MAAAVVWGGYRLFMQQMNQPPEAWEIQLALVGGLVGMGIVLGWLGSYFAARRFIQSVELH